MTRRGTQRRRIAVITGTRAEYGLLRSAMLAIRAHPRLELRVIATGMHLLPKFGSTVRDIVRDGFTVDARVRMQRGDDGPLDQAEGLGRGVAGIAKALHALRADVALVLGDRIEAMAGALAAVTTGVPVAHVHGGDLGAGDFDDALRGAISRVADVHLPATRESAKRLVRAGIDPAGITVVGAPGLDRIIELAGEPPARRAGTGGALVVQHAYGRSAGVERRVMRELLRAVRAEGLSPTVVYPNSDRGHDGVIAAIEEDVRRHGTVVHLSLPRDGFLAALMAAEVIVGNSSSGIIESCCAGTPAVNVGERQAGRQRCGPSVIDAEETFDAIRQAIRLALTRRPRIGRGGAYGDGTAGRRIAAALAGTGVARRTVC